MAASARRKSLMSVMQPISRGVPSDARKRFFLVTMVRAAPGIVEGLLVLVDGAVAENPLVVFPVDIGLVARAEIVISFSNELAKGPAHQLAHRLVDDDKAASFILDEDRVRNSVDNAPQRLQIGKQIEGGASMECDIQGIHDEGSTILG